MVNGAACSGACYSQIKKNNEKRNRKESFPPVRPDGKLFKITVCFKHYGR